MAKAASGDGTWYEVDGWLNNWAGCNMGQAEEVHIVANPPALVIGQCEDRRR
ncbi:hypothetical protein [Microtetraspora malaysiensis]|uniref:hypothetical protein n=1 Tax=Microtetraspora malaysiensis TaxID=161358 RepID=UPI000B2DAAEF|nr:hypothetical protein [Microtetraspora malaysiensis]